MTNAAETRKVLNPVIVQLEDAGLTCFDCVSWAGLIVIYDALMDHASVKQIHHDTLKGVVVALKRKAAYLDECDHTDLYSVKHEIGFC